MTALTTDPSPTRAGAPARLLAGTEGGPLLDHGTHRRQHGAAQAPDLATLASAAESVGLLGRGGAAFPVATKLRSTQPGRNTRVVVNVSEGEPASHKDRVLARSAPHLIIDGALVVAAALRTRHVTVVVRDEEAGRALAGAVARREDAQRVRVRTAAGPFVGGEVRSMLRSLEGHPPTPPGRRVLPTVAGLHGKPTFASNAETFAHVGLLATHGPDWYAEVGSAHERGTTLLTLLGDVPVRGVVEVALGTPLTHLLGTGRGPMLVGGYHGTWVDDVDGLTLDRASLKARGIPLGAGVLARIPHDVCALAEVAVVARWLAGESAGQCGPCFFGLPAVAADLEGLLVGRMPPTGLDGLARRLGQLPGRGACAHPDGASQFSRSALGALQHEVAQHLAHGTCGRPYRGVLPVEGAR